MTSRNRENPSLDWILIRRRYEGECISIRALAREHHTSDTVIRRKAQAGGWVRGPEARGLQQRPQQIPEKQRPWSFETRRDALVKALRDSRANVKTVEDSIYCDVPVVLALLYFRAPLNDIIKAVQLSEEAFAEIFGPACNKFLQRYSGPLVKKRERRGARV